MKKYILLFSIFAILLIQNVSAETVSLLSNTDRCIYNKQMNKDYCEAEYEIEGIDLKTQDISFLFQDDRERIFKNYHSKLQLTEYEYEIESEKIKVKISGWKNPFYNIDHVFCYNGQCEYQFAWWNSSFEFKYPLNASCENCSNDVTFLLLANGTNGIEIDNTVQYLWCEDITIPNTNFTQIVGYMYFNNASDTTCVNVDENVSLDTFIDEGNRTTDLGFPEKDLVVWVTLNGTDGFDKSIYHNALVSTGGTPTREDGMIAHGVQFIDTSSEFLDYGDIEGISGTDSGELTISAWAKRDGALTGSGIIVAKAGAAPLEWYFSVIAATNNYTYEFGGQTGVANCRVGSSPGVMGGGQVDATSVIGVWDHVLIGANSSNCWMYINGNLLDFSEWTIGGLQNTNKDFRIGAETRGGFWDGTIDNVMIWNRTLSPDEIKALSQLEFSLGELEEVETINTSIKHFDIGIDSFLVTSNNYETVFNGTANITTIRDIVIKSSANARKQSGTGTTSELSMKIIFNNVTLMDQIVRTITGTSDIGVFTIPMTNATTLSGNNNLAIQFKRTTNDPINITNLVIHIDLDVSKTDGVVFKNLTKADIIFNSIAYTNIFNFSLSKSTNSTVILDVFHQFESDTNNIIPECYFENLITGERTLTYKRFLSSIGDVGSSGINCRSQIQVSLTETWGLYCKADKAGDIINNVTVYMLEQRDSASYFINGFQNGASINGLSGSGNTVINTSYINQNGTSLEIMATVIMQSTTGAQQGTNSPTFTVLNDKGCSTTYTRSLTNNNDIGTAKFYLNCGNLTAGEVVNYKLNVDLSNTELLNILNASLSSYETEEQNISEGPVLPIILIILPQNNSIVEGIINITALVVDLSNIGWFSEILLFNTTGFVTTILNEITLENTTIAPFDTETVENGNYTIQWIVTNIAGVDSDNVSIIISNLPPPISFNASLTCDVCNDLPIRRQFCDGNNLKTIRERESCTEGQCQTFNQTDTFECTFGCSDSTLGTFGNSGCIESPFLLAIIVIIIIFLVGALIKVI